MEQGHRPRQHAKQLRVDLCSSTGDGACFSAMVGLSETYFPAYFLAIGSSDFEIGILLTVPYLIGACIQMLTPWGVKRFYSFRRWVVVNAALQATSLLLMGLLTWNRQAEFWAVLALVSLYWGGGLATNPVWNTWMEFLVPRQIRARFLSARMRICQICLVLAVTLAGFAIESSSQQGRILTCFALLLVLASICRYSSSLFLNRKSERRKWIAAAHRPRTTMGTTPTSPTELTPRIARLTIPFFVSMQFAVFVSAPFFVPFMLRIMKLDYTDYMFLIVLGYLGRILVLQAAGRFANRYGPAKLLLLGSIGMIPLSGLWIFHQSYWFLCVLQVIGGAIWACYELAVSLVLIEKITGPGRLNVLSWLNSFNGVAMVSGMLLGGTIVRVWSSVEWAFIGVFILSSAFRIAAFAFFPFRLLQIQGEAPPIQSAVSPGQAAID